MHDGYDAGIHSNEVNHFSIILSVNAFTGRWLNISYDSQQQQQKQNCFVKYEYCIFDTL